MENGFVFLDEMLHGIRWDSKYATWDNFTGKPVDGYEVNRIAGTYDLGLALMKVRQRAAALGYGLLLWDAYRPKRAVNCFLRWAAQPEDERTKARYYPHIEKREIISRGYIAAKSSHSRGSTVDLTLYRLDTCTLVPMGGDFDFMDERSHHETNGVSAIETQNRRILRSIMEDSGFKSYSCEWWHYVLCDEPYPDSYFDFPVL
ncbi:MAG: D-Ala-D-Ala dipeptidase VanX [Oscillospiraceae bacterium]|nr:D-Ala-D-Ala dipeptidase VanX [Oscillospiraceae bacterium]